ncbi:tRNA 2-selenouridine(34) synthase MnmH [Campylobacter sp. 19-13652]|uniref:tRNA 2-selenouridine(34) synthase MnmH n=1 Tax=Campylobacter sp. 19-13652 TaxID=2840180 RepID=UPI001C79030C|nr:tRNA 2-selenouridine(34) synthase MnmH [Campylobacter sp. 19-13652]BCX79486.1 tRNA 2-selenouridine synthase [Campylobacter sp. 19-13652]
MHLELEVDEWLEARDKFDLLIDARSPHEYAYSHIKGSRNFYALNDEEHKITGTLYKSNKSQAKLSGAAYVCNNIASHLPKIAELARVGALVGTYCARGGMRSASISNVLDLIGYRVLRLKGGYKAYRTYAQEYLQKPLKCGLITLFGGTGSYKTKLIEALNPAINLEKMANHLGSVFGDINGVQPSQKAFEDELFESLRVLENDVVFIEGESRRIGSLTLPASLYAAMGSGVGVHIVASLERRVECTMMDYKGVTPEFFHICMAKISPFISKEARDDAIKFFSLGELEKVCEILLVKYYDKVYKAPRKVDFIINADDFNSAKNELLALRDEILSKHKDKKTPY